MKHPKNIITTTILLALGVLALSPTAHALNPPPDGGYFSGNTAEGQNALSGPGMIAGYNTGVGYYSLASLTDGGFNTGVGAGTLFSSIGQENTATGAGALLSNTTGETNTANGAFALVSNITGSNNVALGYEAGFNSTGSNNIYIGAGIEGFASDDGVCRIGSIYGATITNGTEVFANSDNRLGTITSSKRFKRNITPTSAASEMLYELQPVRFQYKKEIDPEGRWQFGLVAEDVEKVNPNLIVRDKEGRPYSVRYDQVNAMLLNEFLKEHRKVKELEAIIAKQQKDSQATATYQQKQIETLAAGLRKVSAQLEVSRPAQQVVEKNQ